MAGKMVKGLGGNSSSQSVRDRLNAAKHSISGSGLAKSICKATTDQVISPKAKHLTYLTMCTNEPNVSIPEMADKLLQRTQDASWVVVFKALITVHNLMNQGNERFTQYVASNNRTVNLQSFSDKSGVQGYDMSLFIRRYARYINQKAISYRTMAFDFCRVKRGKTDGVLRTMNTEKLLKALPVIQEQVDTLVEFDATPDELCNNVINAAFILLFNDLIRLFACYNDGVINLLEQYFDMNKKQCREALDIYKKFVLRMEKVQAFLRVAERAKQLALEKKKQRVYDKIVRETLKRHAEAAQNKEDRRFGIDKGDIPDLAKAPSSLLEALEQHLASLEGRKITGSTVNSTTNSTSAGRSAGDKPSSTVNGSGGAASFTLTQAERHKIIEEEKQRLAAFKEQRQLSLERMAVTVNQSASSPLHMNEDSTPTPASATTTIPAQVRSASPSIAPSSTAISSNARPSDDLFGMFEGHSNVNSNVPTVPPTQATTTASPWPVATGQPNFGREVNFEAAFGTQSQTTASGVSLFSALTPHMTKPSGWLGQQTSGLSVAGGFGLGMAPSHSMGSLSTVGLRPFTGSDFGHILQPQTTTSNVPNQLPTTVGDVNQGGPSVITKDIDTSLASLAGNLNISNSDNMKKQDHKWINPSVTMQQKTGGTTFAGPTIASGPTINWSAPATGPTPTMTMNSPPPTVYNMGYFPNFSTNMAPVVAPAWQPQPGTMYAPNVMPQVNTGFAPVGYMPAPGMTGMPQQMQPQMGAFGSVPTQPANFPPVQQRPQAPPTDPFGL